MNMTLEEYRKYLGDDSLTDEQVVESYKQAKQKFDSEVGKLANNYDSLDMDLFVKRVGPEKIDAMNKINEKLNRSELVNGKLVEKRTPQTRENIEEWKKGFMDGFEEAYKRLYGK